ncbi:aminoacyl-tRNA hydrolase [Longibacter salinarum]|uniref:Peptidyl-tRNA hydrolase n=1 Tax=Longibacter salinarum TaxID=1850348 RepID=A0A2A8CY10_9BACT|nr:aminoacyl-tRNA hydrolase [Longibacter salinarum]PEN13501.1 aminoacyl-tRNA hydrolase [Longibacter salinarum]
MSSKHLIVGLGNPGPKYAGTRHNVGFRVIDVLAERLNVDLRAKNDAERGETRYGDAPLLLVKPLTFMNRSGDAVRPIARYNNIAPDNILVIYDDLHLDVGQIRLRPGGSSAGHNGIESVCNQLGTTDIPRLRIGIGNDFAPGRQSNYVLSTFTPQQKAELEDTLITACNATLAFVEDGIDEAMNRYN